MNISFLKIQYIIIWVIVFYSCSSNSEAIDVSNSKEYLPEWEEGYLDIHHIVTGRGNCTFFKLPDGTTLLLDVGDLGNPTSIKHEIMPAVPNDSKKPAEWIAQYLKRFDSSIEKINFVLLTHFHGDHIGTIDDNSLINNHLTYKLSGITHLANLIPIETLIDRGYPNYDYPSKEILLSANVNNFQNYHSYVTERESSGLKTEGFIVGSNSQIKLKNKTLEYKDFEIRNIYANGKIWSGMADESRRIFPENIADVGKSLSAGLLENVSSCAIKLTYGAFSYFSGGDILGAGNPYWADVESPVGELIGQTDVIVANHHGYSDTMNSNFIKSTKPKAFIIPVWDYYHPQPDPLSRMLDTTLYNENRMIFATGLVVNNRIRLGELGQQIKPEGHIVIRVYPHGEKFQIFVLNDHDENYQVIFKTEILDSK